MRTADSKVLRTDAQLLLTAGIWGFAFVAQRAGMDHVGPFTYNGVRFLLGALSLVPLLLLHNSGKPPRAIYLHGLAAGLLLFAGSSLQQAALQFTTAGKAGFITGLYVVLVPFFGHLLGRKSDSRRWVGALLALGGLYFLSVTETFSLAPGDGMVMLCAVFFAAHVLYLSYVSARLPTLELSLLQYAVCAAFSIVVALAAETPSAEGVLAAWLPIAYGGVCSVGIAYSLQVHAQKRAHASHAAIILSLEGLFAALGGFLLLGEQLTQRNLLGCLLMLSAMIASQWKQITAERRVPG